MYWKEWLHRAFGETAKLFNPWVVKLLPPTLVPAFLYLEFGMGGLASLSAVWKVAIALAESYALAFFLIYAWKLFAVVPILLKERDTVIADLKKPPPIAFRGEMAKLHRTTWTDAGNQSAMSVSALITVRYFGDHVNMSVHHFQMWMLGADNNLGSTFCDGPWEFKGKFMKRQMEFSFNPIRNTEIQRAFAAAGSRWKYTFRDHEDTEYESEEFTFEG